MKRWIALFTGCVISLQLAQLLIPSAWTAEDNGAYIERMGNGLSDSQTWYLPPRAELIVVDQREVVQKAVFDKGSGKIITALPLPDQNTGKYAAFYSDGQGLSSRIPVEFSQTQQNRLLPPTIYSIPNINDQSGALGFIGMSYTGSLVKVEITLSTNEKREYNSLANTNGEWQIIPPKLPPGRHQAKAYATFQDMRSADSQVVTITVLNQADQFIEDLGTGTRQSLDTVISQLPAPVKSAAQAVDKQSEFFSKFLLPTLLTISTLAQSGIVAQNLIYLLFQALLGLGQLLGIVKRGQPMGVVYDAVTKRPLGQVIVRLYEAATHRLIETDVTTAYGVFSFMPAEGYYYLRAFKPGYIFPSQIVLSKRDGRYAPIYSGGEIHVGGTAAVVNVSVPLDPEAFQETFQMRLVRIWHHWFEPLNRWLLALGFFLSLLAYSRTPNRLNFAVLWMYVGGLAYYWYQGRKVNREYGLVINALGKPMPGVELVLLDTEYNRIVSRRVTDERGHYQFLAPPGKYKIKVETPSLELMTSGRGGYQGEDLQVQGERGQTKHLVPKIAVKEVRASSAKASER